MKKICLFLLLILFAVAALTSCGAGGGAGSGSATTSYYANWTCGQSTQCASVMGGPSGSQGPFSALSACQSWCNTYIPGACSCSSTPSGGGGGGGSPTLASITVTPANISIPLGLTQQYTATGHYSDGTTQDITTQVYWSSGTPTVASMNLAGQATGLGPGSTLITASVQTGSGISGSTTLTVTPLALLSITVTPANPSVAVGDRKSVV